jgi:hypothetical protein
MLLALQSHSLTQSGVNSDSDETYEPAKFERSDQFEQDKDTLYTHLCELYVLCAHTAHTFE